MRICLFTPTFLPLVGGAEKNADLLARGLIARGHQVQVLAQRPREAFTEPTLPYPVHRFGRPPLQHLWPELLTFPLRRLYGTFPFDVVLAFYSYPTGYAAGLIKHKLRYALVISPRGADLYENFHMLRKPRVKSVIRAGYESADRIVTISQWMVGRLRAVVGRTLPPTEVVYNGIDLAQVDCELAEARAATVDLGVKPPFVLHLARVAPIKNQTLAVDAVAKMREVFASRGMKYVIAGDGNGMAALREQVARLNLGDVVVIAGTRTGFEKAWLMANASFLVSTSKEEALGTVQIESMAAGLPMLASDIPPHKEMIEGKGWAELFHSGDVNDLVVKMRGMIEADLTPMRQRAMELRGGFTLERMIDRYERACIEALEERHKKTADRS